MSGGVDRIEIECHELGADIGRTPRPVKHRVHALGVRDLHRELLPVARQDAVGDRTPSLCRAAPWNGRARPEHGRAANAGFFRLDPDRLGFVPPIGIDRGHGEGFFGATLVFHPVGRDPVMVGNEASHQRPVVRESLGRERRTHQSGDAAIGKGGQSRRQAAVQIVGMEPVDRHEDRHALALLRNSRRSGRYSFDLLRAACREREDGKSEGGRERALHSGYSGIRR